MAPKRIRRPGARVAMRRPAGRIEEEMELEAGERLNRFAEIDPRDLDKLGASGSSAWRPPEPKMRSSFGC